MSNFIQDCLEGHALMSEIDDYIEKWHESDSQLSLHSYLGMTEKEYSLFVQDESYLGAIVAARKTNEDIVSLIKDQYSMAARADDTAKTEQLKRWLENEKLWE